MRKLFGFMLLCATCVFTLSSCSEDEDDALGATLNKTSLTLYVNQTEVLTYSGGDCTWASDNSLIASVKNGVVTAHLVGETIIRANDASCKVTVKPQYTKYEEPYLGWGQSQSTVKNHMSNYKLTTSSSTSLTYEIDSKTFYGYSFENNKLEISTILTTSASVGEYLVDFVKERYVPVTYDEDYYGFCTPDKKTAVIVQVTSSYIAVGYAPLSDSKTSKRKTEDIFADSLKELKKKMDEVIQE